MSAAHLVDKVWLCADQVEDSHQRRMVNAQPERQLRARGFRLSPCHALRVFSCLPNFPSYVKQLEPNSACRVLAYARSGERYHRQHNAIQYVPESGSVGLGGAVRGWVEGWEDGRLAGWRGVTGRAEQQPTI